MTSLNEDQTEILQQLKQSNAKYLKQMDDNEILEALRAMARPMFEIFLQDMKVELSQEGENISFQVHAHESVGAIMQNVVNSFCTLMRSYETLYGNDKNDAGVTVLGE